MLPDYAGSNEEFTLPKCQFAAPEGKRFKSWQIDGVEYAAGDTIKVTGDITIYAVWKNNDYEYYDLYREIVKQREALWGMGTATNDSYLQGVAVIRLLDMNNDGIDELIMGYIQPCRSLDVRWGKSSKSF